MHAPFVSMFCTISSVGSIALFDLLTDGSVEFVVVAIDADFERPVGAGGEKKEKPWMDG
jgi:hypothetical protein